MAKCLFHLPGHDEKSPINDNDSVVAKGEVIMFWSVKKGYYRAFQRVMKVAANVLPFPIPVLLTGAGSVMKLAENISVRGHKKVLVVTDKVLMNLKLDTINWNP